MSRDRHPGGRRYVDPPPRKTYDDPPPPDTRDDDGNEAEHGDETEDSGADTDRDQ